MAVLAAGEGAQVFRQWFAGQRAGGQHRDLPRFRQALLLPPLDRHQGMGVERLSEGCAVAAAINSKGPARWHGVVVCGADHQRPQAPQLLLQQAGGPITA